MEEHAFLSRADKGNQPASFHPVQQEKTSCQIRWDEILLFGKFT
jgi:hypothetical protein